MNQTNSLLICKVTLIAGGLALAGCTGEFKSDSDKKNRSAQKEKAVLVELAEVKQGMIEAILERSAPLEAEAQVEVAARTSNPATELLVEEGDNVKKKPSATSTRKR